jgi:type VI secretion system secreted protein Hcp
VAFEAQLMIVGARQGLILGPGKSEAEGRVFGVDHQIVVSRSPAAGMPTGKRYHKLLTVRRDFSPVSLGIREALSTNEILPEVRIRFYLPTPLGPPKQQFTLQLFNANVCGVRVILPYTRTLAKRGAQTMSEEVSFTYLSIQWTWNDPPMVATDDWMLAR